MQQHDGGRILVARLTIKHFSAAYRRVVIRRHVSRWIVHRDVACYVFADHCDAGPLLAKVHAAIVPPVPPPRIIKSYSSTLASRSEGVFRVMLMPRPFGNN